jgi:DNA-binding NarL/FixJ family response regulator
MEEQTETEAGPVVKVLVADDHTLMREGLVDVLDRQTGIVVVGEAEDGRCAVEQARKLQPDVVLMDIAMPELNGIEATRRIKEETPEMRVVALSLHTDEEMVEDILEAGAETYIYKGEASDELFDAVRGDEAEGDE